MKIKVINGANLNLLGLREPALYGSRSYSVLCAYIESEAEKLGIEVDIFQSNHEGAIVDEIQSCITADGAPLWDGLIVNAAAYTHTSLAIADALSAVRIPVVEVHLTEPLKREEYRHFSYVSTVAVARFAGDGFDSYVQALQYFAKGN